MTTALAVPSDNEHLDTVSVAAQIQKLRQACEWVRSCPEQEALDAKRQAELVQQWVRIHKAAATIAIEACRLQATALRRLCQLQCSAIKGQELSAGRWLAEMSDAEFDGYLAGMKYARTPVGLHRDWLKQQEAEINHRIGRDIGGGRSQPEPVDEYQVHRAANALLHSSLDREATTVNELAEDLASCLGFDSGYHRDFAIRQGLQSVIREALRNESFEDVPSGHPEFVTWKDRTLGWLRIPWGAATLSQFEWMAEFRQQQAKELQVVADDLSSLAVSLRRTANENPGVDRLRDLWELAE